MRPSTFPRTGKAQPALHRIAAALLAAMTPLATDAATIIVTSPDDTTPAASDTCTLRQSIVSMNTGQLVGNCAVSDGMAFGVDDTITFAASALTGATTPGTVTLADSADTSGGVGGTLVVSATNLTIDGRAWRGSGANQYPDGVTIARPGGASNRFSILRDTAPAGGRLALDGLAIRNGYALATLCNARNFGGGVCMVAADLSMTDSTVADNFAGNGGGGIATFTGALTLTRCTIDHNVAYLGGGLYAGTGTATVTASTISANGEWAVSHGGGILANGTLVVTDSTISGNKSKHGASIRSGGVLTVSRSLVAGGTSYYDSGGIQLLAGSTATVTGSTIANNAARYDGGGLHVAGVLTLSNSTIVGNHAHHGGGIALLGGGTLHLDHATLTQNSAGGTSGTGGGIGIGHAVYGAPWIGSIRIDHSIVSDNTQGSGSEIDAGIAWSGNGNLVSIPGAALGPLQDNGGPTPTMLPGPGSAALDAIAPQDCTQGVDQRGFARPQGAGCDIGAVEVTVDSIFASGFDLS